MSILITFLISVLILILSFLGLAMKLLFKKNKKFLLMCSSQLFLFDLNNKSKKICLVCGQSI